MNLSTFNIYWLDNVGFSEIHSSVNFFLYLKAVRSWPGGNIILGIIIKMFPLVIHYKYLFIDMLIYQILPKTQHFLWFVVSLNFEYAYSMLSETLTKFISKSNKSIDINTKVTYYYISDIIRINIFYIIY